MPAMKEPSEDQTFSDRAGPIALGRGAPPWERARIDQHFGLCGRSPPPKR